MANARRPRAAAASARRARLSSETVLAEALALVDELGAEALTLRRLAARLDVDPMAVYWHLPDKDAILDGVIGTVLAEMVPPEPGAPWIDQVRAVLRENHRVFRAHPSVYQLLLDRVSTAPEVWASGDRLLDTLETKLAPDLALLWWRVLGSFVSGCLFEESRRQAITSAATENEAVVALRERSRLAKLLTTEPPAPDAFAHGLDILLAALERAAGPASRRRPGERP